MDYRGTTTKAYISSINFLDQRDILNEVFDVTSEDATILDIMELTGKMSPTDVPQYSAFMDDYLFQTGLVASVPGAGAGSGLVSLASSDPNGVLTVTLTAQTLADGNTSFNTPLVGELCMLPNKQLGRVRSVTSTSIFTIEPINQTDVLNVLTPVVTAASVIVFYSDAQGEGDSDPIGRKSRLIRTENQVQIFKTANAITDIQKVSKVEVRYSGQDYIMYKLQHDTLRQHRMKIAFQMLVGKKSTMTDTVTGNTVYMTQGIRQSILAGDGTVYTVGGIATALGGVAPTQAQLKTMNRSLDKRQAPKEYQLWCGGGFRAGFQDLVLGLTGLTSGGIVYNAFGDGDGKKRALDLGVDTFRIYGRTLHVKTIDAYDHPNVFGGPQFGASSLDQEAYFIPSGKIKTDLAGKTDDYLRIRYMAGDNTDLKYYEAVTGKLAPTPTDGAAVLRFSYESVMGLQAIGTRLFAIFN